MSYKKGLSVKQAEYENSWSKNKEATIGTKQVHECRSSIKENMILILISVNVLCLIIFE